MRPEGVSGINPHFQGLFPREGQVGYALLTRAPVDAQSVQALSVVSPRLACVKPVAAFILSQDQTLHCKISFLLHLSLLGESAFVVCT